MFEFGRELKRILGADASRDDADASLLELIDAELLHTEAKAANVSAGRVSTKDRHPRYVEAALIWREHARRTGLFQSLREAASACELAGKHSRTAVEAARAALEQALTCLTGVDLFGGDQLLAAARGLVEEGAGGARSDPLLEARYEAAFARVASREALAANDYDRALEAAALFDAAVHRLDGLAKGRGASTVCLEAALARIERADLLAGFGLRLKERRLLEHASADLAQLVERLDADYEPLTFVRCEELRGSTLVALGEVAGLAEKIAEGVSVLARLGAVAPSDHSPLDWARSHHALGLGLEALGETCDSDTAFEQAEAAFDQALVSGDRPGLVLRATVANNRAACLARAAERRGDLIALARAEGAFKAELAGLSAEKDPVGWAVLQVNLGRLYESRAELLGDFREREQAAYAFEGALDVFAEHGLKALAENAGAGLERVRASAGSGGL